MRSGFFRVSRCRRSVSADVDGAQARAAAGFDHPLRIAVVDAGVDVDAAEAEAVAVTPAVAPMMEAVSGSGGGSESGRTERSRGDQSEGNLAKHCRSPVDWREAVVWSLRICRIDAAARSTAKRGFVFQECFVGEGDDIAFPSPLVGYGIHTFDSGEFHSSVLLSRIPG